MRGTDQRTDGMFSYISTESRVPKNHPLRRIGEIVDGVLGDLDAEFASMYSHTGRPSIAPERLVRAMLLQILYSIRSERQLIEQLDFNLLFRWFVGMTADEPVWNATTFTKNRERFASVDLGRRMLGSIVDTARRQGLTSSEHFSVDGTLIAAWASQKSVRRKDGNDDDNPDGVGRNAGRNFHGERRRNDTHESRTDPEALIASKSKGMASRPSYGGHILMENRNGLVVDAELTQATGTAERDAALDMAAGLRARSTLGADKGYDTAEFVEDLRAQGVTPHVAQNTGRKGGSAIDGRTTRHASYTVSQRIRKRIEEVFGWAKQIGPMRQTKLRGRRRVEQQFLMTVGCWNLVRIRNLMAASG